MKHFYPVLQLPIVHAEDLEEAYDTAYGRLFNMLSDILDMRLLSIDMATTHEELCDETCSEHWDYCELKATHDE